MRNAKLWLTVGLAVVAVGIAASAGAESVELVFDGEARLIEGDVMGDVWYSDPFAVTLGICFEVDSYSSMPWNGPGGVPQIMHYAMGDVASWWVEEPAGVTYYYPDDLLAPYDPASRGNWWLGALYQDVATLAYVEGDLMAQVSGSIVTGDVHDEFQGSFNASFDPATFQGQGSGSMMWTTWWVEGDLPAGQTWGYDFAGTFTGYSLGCCGDEIVPEPASLTLLGLGMGALAIRRIRRRR